MYEAHFGAFWNVAGLYKRRYGRGDQEHEAGNEEKDTAEHRPEAADAGDDEADCRNDEKDPANQVDCVVRYVTHQREGER